MSSKLTATVKWFDPAKGVGFLTNQSGTDIFFHHSAIVSDERYAILKAGQEVEYTPVQTERGLQAQEVTPQPIPANT